MVNSTFKQSESKKNAGLLKYRVRNSRKKRTRHNFTRKRKKKAPKENGVSKFFIVFSGAIFFLIIAFVIWGALYLKHLENSLPEPYKLVDRTPDQTTIITDRNGNELYKIYADQNRKFVRLDELPEHLKWAIISTEDRNFYEHGGFDLEAIIKSAYINFVVGDIVRGASTITQQLVRNTLMYDVFGDEAYEETYTRKIKEILLTIQVENTLTKDEILQMYINEVGFGGVNHGIQAASLAYFNKDAKELTLAESAMLAGVIASPSNYSPIYSESFDLPTRRQHAILNAMLRNKEMTGVTERQIEKAKNENLKYAPLITEIEAPHFVFHVKRELEEIYGDELVARGGLHVKTSLDLSTQKIAQEEIAKGIPQYGHKWNVHNGAMIVLDPNTNQILAMVGSINYWEDSNSKIDGNVNITTSRRQMGSSVKPYTYLAALQRGYTPNSIVPDKPITFGNYRVRNWDGKHFGDITIRQALIQSRNIPAVYVLRTIGIDAFVNTAQKMGITTINPEQYHGLSITLGTAEMTLLEHSAAFSIFANGGIKRPISSILEITDSQNNVIYENNTGGGHRVFDEKLINDINWILCDLGNFGDQPQHHLYTLNGRRMLCGKTGTTDGPRDLVSITYHKNLVVGIWAGNNNNVPTPGAWSTTVPLPISHSFFQRVADKYEAEI